MGEEAAVSIAVVCEAPADRRTACGIADRIICAEVDWIEPEVLEAFRSYRGAESNEEHLEWTQVDKRPKAKKFKAHGHFDGKPGVGDARTARLALWLLNASQSQPQAVLFIRDTDGDPNRRVGLEQARETSKAPWPIIVIGAAHPMRECWVLAGFEPRNQEETDRLQQARKDLGFNPHTHAHKLTAKNETAKRSAKRVLRELVCKDGQREAACWEETAIDLLKQRGRHSGLTDYIAELRERLIALFGQA